jgi:predicted DNA-binding WGR domain protein
MIQLTRTKPSSNLRRFYTLHLAPTLFGQWALVMEWGRSGSPDTVRQQLFENEQAAESALTKRVTRKTRRGYVCVETRLHRRHA